MPAQPIYPKLTDSELTYLKRLADSNKPLAVILKKLQLKDAECRAYSHDLLAVLMSIRI